MGGFGVELFLHFAQYLLKSLYVDLPPVLIQDFNKTAHVCSLEAVRQIDIHIYIGIDVLCPVCLVEDYDWVFYPLHAYFLYIYIPVIFETLYVYHFFLCLCPY